MTRHDMIWHDIRTPLKADNDDRAAEKKKKGKSTKEMCSESLQYGCYFYWNPPLWH